MDGADVGIEVEAGDGLDGGTGVDAGTDDKDTAVDGVDVGIGFRH